MLDSESQAALAVGLCRTKNEGLPTVQHGLERWLVRPPWWRYSVPTSITRETPDTYFLSKFIVTPTLSCPKA